MDHREIARAGLALLCAGQGVAQIALDCNRTHATHPGWLGHARFHVVWQAMSVAVGALIQTGLIWRGGAAGFYVAAALACVSPIGFLLALVGRRVYGGTLSDPGGIPPARLKVFGKLRTVEMNLLAVAVALVCVSVLVAMYRGQ